MNKYIYHFVLPDELEKFLGKSHYTVDSLKEEGFIHCCFEEQIPIIKQRYYADWHAVNILKIKVDSLTAVMKVETIKNGEKYPHIFGKINMDAVAEVMVYPQNK